MLYLKISHQIKEQVLTRPIGVLYEDESFIAFDKPAGLLVIATAKQKERTLLSIVNQQFQSPSFHLHLCHRLDRETSGVILFAKGKRGQKLMMDVFKRRQVRKKYIAFVQGRLPSASGELKSFILDDQERKYRKDAASKWAVTRYKILETRKYFSVAEVEPVTGRTNQIRIQFSQMRHPLVGERKYAFARDYKIKFRRTALHALSLEWKHPLTGKMIKIEAPLAKDMEEFLISQQGGNSARNRN